MVLPNRQAKITNFVKKAYHDYFGVKTTGLGFAPHVCCKTCVEKLRDWRNLKKKSIQFTISMVGGRRRRKRSHYGLLFLYNKSKRNKSQG